MLTNYKLRLLVVAMLLIAPNMWNMSTKAMEINKTENVASTYSIKSVNWYMLAGQKTYSSSFYVQSGGSILINVGPSVSGAKYSVGILQPSGTERKITKTGTTSTTYAISSSGYYKVFIHNVTSSALDYAVSYAY